MFRLNRVVATVLAAALAMLLAGCGGKNEEGTGQTDTLQVSDGTPTRGGTVVRRMASDCKTLNWMMITTTYENFIMRLLYDPLIDMDENLDYKPVLAESYDISDDHLKITVKLRNDIRWHDGRSITAEDVAFTVEKIQDPAVPALNKQGYFNKLDHVEVVDPQTVIFHWKEPYAPAMYALTQLSPMPKHVYGEGDFLHHPANRAPVGSGPFKFEEWRSSQYISVVRNDDYHGPIAYLDRVIFKIIEDDAVALNALKAGEIDEMRVNQLQWEKQTVDDDFLSKFDKYHYFVPSYNYISWNCKSVWFRDARVRQAMTMLFDRESVNAKMYSGYAKMISGPFYINSWAYDKTIKPHPFDPDSAGTLLEAAGWVDGDGDGIRERDGVKFEFELSMTSGSTVAKQLGQLLQEELQKAGVRLKIRQFESATFFDRVDSGEFDACILGWRLDLDPDIYDTFHSSQVPPIGLNHGYYSNAKVDSLLEAGRVEFDQKKRAAIYHDMHRLIHEDQPYTFINTVPEKRPIHKRIKGVVISPDGPFNFYPGASYWYIDKNWQATAGATQP